MQKSQAGVQFTSFCSVFRQGFQKHRADSLKKAFSVFHAVIDNTCNIK